MCSAGPMLGYCLEESVVQNALRLFISIAVCMALNPLLSWLRQQPRCAQIIPRHSLWEYPQQLLDHPHPAIMPGGYLVWELFLPSSCSLWSAGCQSPLSGSAFLGGLYGTEESRRQLLRHHQQLKPAQRALPWFCTLIAQRVWNGSTCAGERYKHALTHASFSTLCPELTTQLVPSSKLQDCCCIRSAASSVS